jgi:hypothetical protein
MIPSKPRKKFDGSFALSLTLLITLGTTLGVTARGFAPKAVTVTAVATKAVEPVVVTVSKPVKATNIVKVATPVATVSTPVQAVVSSVPTQTIQKPVVHIVRRYTQAPIATTRAS